MAAGIVRTERPRRAADKPGDQPSPLDIFDQRILPIFKSPKPSSCVQCHLAAVDLKNYIHPSQEKTFASLRDQGLIDLNHPEKSKVLTLIKMGEKDLGKGARLIHAKLRQAEYEAFAAWIKASSRDPKLRSLPRIDSADWAKPDRSNAVIRHTRKSRVVDSFVRNIWSQRLRCFPCHTSHDVNASNPRHKAALKTQRELKLKYPEEIIRRLQIFRETPEATLQYLIEKSRVTPKDELPLINLDNPTQSLLVLKPTSKLPPKSKDGKFRIPPPGGPMYHMGGLKMHRDDQSYKAFIAWIQDYANVVGNRYASVDELPSDNWFGTKLVLKLTSTPNAWTVGVPVQMFLHARDDKSHSFAAEPVAFTQGTVTPRRMVNGALFLLIPKNSKALVPKYSKAVGKPHGESARLAPGRYLVKVYVDSKRRLAKDPALLLGQEEFAGQSELEFTRWREGFRSGKTLFGANLKKE